MHTIMEYTVRQILEELGGLVNKAQKVRNNLPVEIKRADSRNVCLSGIQTSIEPIMLAYGAIECSNQCIENIELGRVCGIKGRTNKEILDNFDTWAKASLLVFTHFRIESLFFNILIALEPTYAEHKFSKITTDLFNKLTIGNKDEKRKCLDAISLLRNSLHNNSINKNKDFEEIINGKLFKFVKGEPVQGTIHDDIFLVDYALDIIKEVSEAPEVLKLSTPIQDLFHVKIGYE